MPSGTFEAAKAAEQRAAQRKQRREESRGKLLPVDRAALIEGAHPRARVIVPLKPTDEHPVTTILSRTPAAIITDGEAGASDLAGVLARLEAHGVELQAVGDRLLVRAKGGTLDRGDLELIDAFRPLILGYLAKSPPPCPLRHKGTPPPATTMLVCDVPACAAHATGELEA